MKSRDLIDLMFSPVWVSTLLHHFLSGVQQYNPHGIKTELLYLAIPLIVDDITRKQLTTANTKSTLSSIFYNTKELENNRLDIKNALLNKNDHVKQYHEITNRGLIYLGSIEKLDIKQFITVDTVVDLKKEKGIRREFCKAAYYLGIILAKEDYRNVFVKLGITNI